jgi:hypothetical protein
MMVHVEDPLGNRGRFIAFLTQSLHLLPLLSHFSVAILDEPRTLIPILLNTLVFNRFMVTAHYFPKVLHIVRFGGGVGLATDASIRHGHVRFESASVGIFFAHDLSFVEGTMPRKFLLKEFGRLQDFCLVKGTHWGWCTGGSYGP